MRSSRTVGIGLLVAIFIALMVGCFPSSSSVQWSANGHNGPTDAGLDTVPRWIDGGTVDGRSFRKPVTEHESARTFDRDRDRSEGGDEGMGTAVWPREHVSDPGYQRTVYLLKGEYFAVDGSFDIGLDRAPESMEIHVRVFINFRPAPFDLVSVDSPDGWVPRSEFSKLDFSKRRGFELRNGKPFNFTLVVPPRAFGSRAAYDLRMVFYREFSPDPEKSLHGQFKGFTDGFLVRYGGYEVRASARRFPNLQRVRPTDGLDGFAIGQEVFLFPSQREERLRNAGYRDARLGGRVRLTGDPPRLAAIAAGQGSSKPGPGENYYAVLVDGDYRRTLTGSGRVGRMPQGYHEGGAGKWANRLTVDASRLEAGTHSVRILSFPEPYTNWRDTDKRPGGAISNPLFVRVED